MVNRFTILGYFKTKQLKFITGRGGDSADPLGEAAVSERGDDGDSEHGQPRLLSPHARPHGGKLFTTNDDIFCRICFSVFIVFIVRVL